MNWKPAVLVAALMSAAVPLQTNGPAAADVTSNGPVTGSATGSVGPATAVEPATVANGDFTITGQQPGSTVGDGIEERTDWTLDLAADPQFGELPPTGTLERAALTLTLTPGAAGVATDGIRLGSLPFVFPAEFAALQVGVTETVAIDLLDLYSEHDVLDQIAAGAGIVPMRYNDDAVVSFASLDLLAATEAELFASDADVSELFGFSIDVDETTAVVGAPGAVGTGKPGAAYVFTHDGSAWTERAVLAPSTPVAGEEFGYDVVVEDGTIVVGARNPGAEGAAYVFTGTGASWTQDARLTSGALGSTGDLFGTSVDVEGDRIVVGASADDQFTAGSGAAYVFDETGSGWTQSFKIGSGAPSANGSFGDAVLLDSSRVFVGAPVEAAGSFGLAGSVYVFDAAGVLSATIEPADRQNFHGFGTSLSLDGSTLVVGANGDAGPTGFDPTCTGSTATCNPGSVYVYDDTGSGFVLDAELHAGDLDLETNVAPGSQFGLETDLVGDTLIVGARHADGRFTSVGKAHRFERVAGQWMASTRFVASDSRQGDLLGNAVALFGPDGAGVLAGTPNDDSVNGDLTTNEGAVYVFTPSPDNTPPDAIDDDVIVETGEVVEIDVVANDTDAEGNLDETTLSILVPPTSGSALVVTGVDGTVIEYTAGVTGGTDSLVYEVCDTGGLCDAATVTITIVSPDDCTILGTNGPDLLVGTPGDDVICGRKGADVIDGLGGDDILLGGRGSDFVVGGPGADTIIGGRGDDALFGGPGDDVVRGRRGRDHVVGGGGSDELHGGRHADELFGDGGDDRMWGGRGDDWLHGGPGADELHGRRGDDWIGGGAGDDIIRGGRGIDDVDGGANIDDCRAEFVINCESP